jgi:hypothetical protein
LWFEIPEALRAAAFGIDCCAEMLEYAWICLNMLEYAWICLNMLEYAW